MTLTLLTSKHNFRETTQLRRLMLDLLGKGEQKDDFPILLQDRKKIVSSQLNCTIKTFGRYKKTIF